MSAREMAIARQEAEEAMHEFARLSFGWNEPDDEYTRQSIRAIAESAIRTHDPSLDRAQAFEQARKTA